MRTGRKKKCGRNKIRGCAPGRRISDASYDINRDPHQKWITNPAILKIHEFNRIRHQIFTSDMKCGVVVCILSDMSRSAKVKIWCENSAVFETAGFSRPIISCRPSRLRLMSIRLSVRPILRIRTAKPFQLLPHRIMSTDATASTSPHPVEDSIRQKVSPPSSAVPDFRLPPHSIPPTSRYIMIRHYIDITLQWKETQTPKLISGSLTLFRRLIPGSRLYQPLSRGRSVHKSGKWLMGRNCLYDIDWYMIY